MIEKLIINVTLKTEKILNRVEEFLVTRFSRCRRLVLNCITPLPVEFGSILSVLSSA